MKKTLTLILAVLLCMSAFAAFAEERTTLNVYAIYKVDALYFQGESDYIKEAIAQKCEENNCELSYHYLGCDIDPQKCMTYVENAIADKADVIFICVPDQTMSLAIVELCADANVLVVACDDGLIDDEGNKIAPWFGIDAYNIGYAAGEWMADYAVENNCIEDKTIGLLYMTMDTVSSSVPRTEGEKDAWADKLGADAMADRTYFANFETTSDLAYNSASAVITGHPEIEGWLVMTPSENGAMGCGAALEEAEKVEKSCILCLGCEETANQWDEGNYEVIRECAYFSGKLLGREAGTRVAAYLFDGEELPEEYAISAVMVDPTNYNDIVIR